MTNSLAVRSVLTLVPAPGPTDVNLTDSAATDWNNADGGENDEDNALSVSRQTYSTMVATLGVVEVSDDEQSGCEVGARVGDCSEVNLVETGLDHKTDRRSCCCPGDTVCNVYNCACNYVPKCADQYNNP
ncbi:hypothetical protein F442_13311 [Phytophthora nicotianae P10297]|uniref:Uncharacterized protein n=2 Tax=Phytophthora nicotianae P10297 TaxID=1317064 RepID=W2YZ50_PHYNI|nr:hypothetical protein F442_13311 [Phytophthora nicotianae P10297]